MEPRDCLRRYPLFNLLSARQLDAWLQGSAELTLSTGETVFQEGASGIWAYMVLEGRVRVLRRADSKRDVSLGQFGPGEVFGDYALLHPSRYTATCRAASDVRLLGLPLLHLRRILASERADVGKLKHWLCLHALVSYLRGQSFLGFISAPSSLRFLDSVQPVTFQALRTIQADGLGDDCWYFIENGNVCLDASDDGPAGSPRELGPGDCFGEQALLGRSGLSVAVALTDVRCLCLTRAAFTGQPGQTPTASVQSLSLRPPSLCEAYVWISQQEAADCGVAALAMVARFHGLDVTVDSVRESVPIGPEGASLLELQRAALLLGLRSLAVRVAPEQLGQVAPPAIVHFRGGHYVVLYEIGSAGVAIGDPVTGLVRLSPEKFAESCSGKLLLVRPPAPDS